MPEVHVEFQTGEKDFTHEGIWPGARGAKPKKYQRPKLDAYGRGRGRHHKVSIEDLENRFPETHSISTWTSENLQPPPQFADTENEDFPRSDDAPDVILETLVLDMISLIEQFRRLSRPYV